VRGVEKGQAQAYELSRGEEVATKIRGRFARERAYGSYSSSIQWRSAKMRRGETFGNEQREGESPVQSPIAVLLLL